MEKFVCIHGHFYQPPRENPWLEEIEVQDSAYPYHDWNERITAECYGPNAASRMLDDAGQISSIVNNYASLSFNFGPTLLSWLQHKRPAVYDSILEADRSSRDKFSGHGAALCQVYNHMIMPLANDCDKRTQVVWGIRDFEFRYQRKPEGIWLPETAVDVPTLEVLAELGITFTILSPYQAARVRALGETEWQDATEGKIDPTRAYVQKLPSGKSINVFFYDGPISRAVAFEKLLDKGEYLSERLMGGFFDERDHPQLVHIATDGESYGHHHPHGDMALAYALTHIEQNPDVKLTIYGEYLELHPPTHEVEIAENTSWSCFHGIERWRSNCGCNSGREQWHQEWRAPLREALDWLRDQVTPLFEERGRQVLQDPWAARDDYIGVILDRSPENIDEFLHDHALDDVSDQAKVTILKLMELQRHAMLMYTSCGWFFDDISGIETVQVIAYAGRVLQLAAELFGREFTGEFLTKLAEAKSNVPAHRDGKYIFKKWIEPSVLGWDRITAHYAVSSLFEDYADHERVFCYNAERKEFQSLVAGKAKLVIGRTRITSEITREEKRRSFGVIHFGDHNVNGGVCRFEEPEEYQELVQELVDAFEKADFPQILRLFDKGFGESTYSLKSLFRDEQRKVVDQLLAHRQKEAEEAYRRLYDDNLPTMRFLADLDIPLPTSLRAATEFILRRDLAKAFHSGAGGTSGIDVSRIRQLLEEAKRWDVPLDAEGLAFQLKNTLGKMANRFQKQPAELTPLLALEQVVDLALALPFAVELWEPQNVYFRVLQTIYPELEAKAHGDETSQAWLEHFQELGEKLGVRVGALKKKITQLRKAPSLAGVLDDIFTRPRIPSATYRLQFNENFKFADAEHMVPYLLDLGISACYLSPILQACPGSQHGYDISDHAHISRELGGEADFDRFASAVSKLGMGLILDMVPNHMGIGHHQNQWWQDVLANGASSPYARYFDIDWHPVNPNLEDKLLLPVLGDQYGAVLEDGQIQLHFEDGAFYFSYYEHRFPVAPCSYGFILEALLEMLQTRGTDRNVHPTAAVAEGRMDIPVRPVAVLEADDDEHLQELQSILTSLRHLPPRTVNTKDQMDERARETDVIKRRLAALVQNIPDMQSKIRQLLEELNGTTTDVTSFDRLDQLLDKQVFRPAFWRVATEEINYRRFFDVNGLAAIRVELPEVFQATHQLALNLLAHGKATGLRIDHPDGLWNPARYFRHLQDTFVRERTQARLGLTKATDNVLDETQQRFTAHINGSQACTWPLYVVAEKILAEGEPLPSDWAVHGTTGYDALNGINGLFVQQRHESSFTDIYHHFTGTQIDFAESVKTNKRLIMQMSLASEINSLSHRLDRISERNRRYRDFTLNSLTSAIREIIAALAVYRTYITGPDAVSERDRGYIEAAVAEAKRHDPRTAAAVFNFIRDTLRLRNLDDFRQVDRPEILDWVMTFQQITGPVMAKGVEDTAFYIYNRLVSLNEVGGHPDHFGISLEEFHEQNLTRQQRWPHSMIASSTHDTKRSEDVRARLNALSEMPQEWGAALWRWRDINAGKKTTVAKMQAPSANDEYLLYQTLVGTWPVEPLTPETMPAYRERIAKYMQKATREAKVHTSWVNPNDDYDSAMWQFVERVLPDDVNDAFVKDLDAWQGKVRYYGFLNSLAQTVLKLTCPGVPDVYQGNEIWDFSLVDPDNRRPVDYSHRRQLLNTLSDRVEDANGGLFSLIEELLTNLPDGRAKLYVTWQTLNFRRRHRRLFSHGDYRAVSALGAQREHVSSFLRSRDGSDKETPRQSVLVAVPRLVVALTHGHPRLPIGPEVWHDCRLVLPAAPGQQFRNLFTGQMVRTTGHEGQAMLAAAELFAKFPVFVGEHVHS